MNKTTFSNDLLTKQMTKVIDEALKPMSIIEIKEKFNLSFPFRVKRVKDSIGNGSWMGVTIITAIFKVNNGVFRTNNGNNKSNQHAEVQDYILYEEN
jgi:hypothetical protein